MALSREILWLPINSESSKSLWVWEWEAEPEPALCPLLLSDLDADRSPVLAWPETDCSKKSETVPAIMPVWRSARTRLRVGIHVQIIEELRISCNQMAGMRVFHGSSRGLEWKRGVRERKAEIVKAMTLFRVRWGGLKWWYSIHSHDAHRKQGRDLVAFPLYNLDSM